MADLDRFRSWEDGTVKKSSLFRSNFRIEFELVIWSWLVSAIKNDPDKKTTEQLWDLNDLTPHTLPLFFRSGSDQTFET